MKETSFIEQNKEKWNRFEKLSESESSDPTELSDLYMDITDDLSYAQTFYQRRTVRVYLNQLAQRVYTGVHLKKAESFKKFLSVWRVSLPLEIYKSRRNLLFALVVFLIWAALSAVTTHFYPNFTGLVLSKEYVEMTNENISNGDPLAVYKGGTQMQMFIDITTNNIKVAFLTFIFGIFFTVGTHILLFKNAMMVGSFQYFFATKGLLITSFLGIWIHGAFEISSIVLAAGAGITMGNGWLFPGNYTRLQSLQISAKRGLKIMMSLVPFFVFAGYLESYVTRNYMDLPEWSKWVLIGLSFGIILFYYIIYPMIVARKYPELLEEKDLINYFPPVKFDLSKIRNFGEIISDTFRFYNIHFNKISKVNFRIILPIIIVLVYLQNDNHAMLMATEHWFDWSKQLEIMTGFGFTNLQDWIINFAWSFVISGMFLGVLFAFKIKDEIFSWRAFFQFAKQKLLLIWFGNFLIFFSLALIPWYWYFVLILLLPFVFLNGIVPGIADFSIKNAIGKGWSFSARSYGISLLNIVIFTLIFALFMQPIALVFSIRENFDPTSIINVTEPIMPDLLDMLADFTKDVAEALGGDRMFWANVVRQIVYVLFLLLVLPIWIISMTFIGYNEYEKETATGLRNAFLKFGKRNRYQENETDFE